MEKLNRRERKKILAQQALTEVAIRLFSEKGFSQTSISDITNEADLATGTFYNYFQSKEDVIRYAISVKIEEAGEVLREIKNSDDSPSNKLFMISKSAGQLMNRNISLFKLLAHLPPMTSPPHGSEFKDILTSIIEEGWRRGDYKKDLPAPIICEAFMAMLQSAMMSRSIPFEENIKLKLTILLEGIST
ncbi:MAG TPA: TetR/AcrR family transcriptional regulator [Deferribacteraceae bacterium]|nr:TetR/AcrR family transcriptional regulator [Deferribacteraceae bacterium]